MTFPVSSTIAQATPKTADEPTSEAKLHLFLSEAKLHLFLVQFLDWILLPDRPK